MSEYDYKQVLVLRKDLGMRRGKEIAQGAHASMAAYLDYKDHPYVKGWLAGKFTKVAVSCDSEEELLALYEKAEGIPRSLIQDAGLTEFAGIPTYTAVAIGPGPVATIDAITGGLKLR